MVTEIYDALIDAGADEGKARKAAESITEYDDKFVSLENKIMKMQGDINLLRWMVGFNLIISSGVLIKLLI